MTTFADADRGQVANAAAAGALGSTAMTPAEENVCAGNCGSCATTPKAGKKMVSLADLQQGETGRVVRVNVSDAGCRRRFAELGLAEGMKVTVASAGETMILILAGARMALAGRCAAEIQVLRV